MRMMVLLLALALASTRLPAKPVITSPPVNQKVVWGGNAIFSVTAIYHGPLTYQWRLNGTNLPDIITVAGGNCFSNFRRPKLF